MLYRSGLLIVCIVLVIWATLPGCGESDETSLNASNESGDRRLRDGVNTELLAAVETTEFLLKSKSIQASGVEDYQLIYDLRQRMREVETRHEAVSEFLVLWQKAPGDIRLLETAWIRRRIFPDRQIWTDLWTSGAGDDTTKARAIFAEARERWGYDPEAELRFFDVESVQYELSEAEQIFLQERLAQIEDRQGERIAAVRRLFDVLPSVWQSTGPANAASVWNNIAKYYLHDSNLDHALLASMTASQCAELSGEESRMLMAAYTGARILTREGRYTAAVDSFESVDARAVRMGSSVWQGVALGRMALIARSLGDNRRALALEIRGLGIVRAQRDTTAMIRRHCAVAGTHRELGELDNAQAHLDSATVLGRTMDDIKSSITIDQARHLYAMQLGHAAEADSLLNVLLALSEVQSDPGMVRNLMLDLMGTGLETGRPDMAYRGLAHARSNHGAFSVLSTDYNAKLWLSLRAAELYAHQGEYDLAEAELDSVGNLMTMTIGARDHWLALQTRGRIADMTGDMESAQLHFGGALKKAEELDDPDKIRRSRIRYGRVLLDLGRSVDARELFVSSREAPEYWSRFASALYTGLAFADEGRHEEALTDFERAAAMLGQGAPGDLSDQLELAESRSLIALGRPEEALEVLQRRNSETGVPATIEQSEELRSFYRAIERERAELHIGLLHDHPELVSRKETARQALIVAERVRSRGNNRSHEVDDWNHEQVSAGSPTLRYFVGEERGFVWLGTSSGLSMRELEGLSDWRIQARDMVSDMSYPGRDIAWDQAAELSTILLKGVWEAWDRGKVLQIAGDGILEDLPWPALPLPGGKGLLIDYGPILHVASGLVECREINPGREGKRALVVGVDGLGAGLIGSDNGGQLHEARREAREMASLFPSDHVDLLLGPEARWDSVRELSMQEYTTIHLATHARLSRGRRGGSTLRFAEDAADRPVTSLEVRSLKLNTDLVYLSCCEGSKVASDHGSGLDSFALAFLQAGARCVVASSLKVEDEASRTMAGRFYHHWLGGEDRATALRAAQLDIRSRDDRWSHPFYWAFIRAMVAPQGH